jgi:hypothetical protein
MLGFAPVKIDRSRAGTGDVYLLSASQLRELITDGIIPDWLK